MDGVAISQPHNVFSFTHYKYKTLDFLCEINTSVTPQVPLMWDTVCVSHSISAGSGTDCNQSQRILPFFLQVLALKCCKAF